MISIRFPDPSAAPAWLSDNGAVTVTTDAALIALESEKNRERDYDQVDRRLRPLFGRLWDQQSRPFRLISIETMSRCNHDCAFCPVARSVDPRPPGKLEWSVLVKIADELHGLGYAGRLALFGNNEPLLDRRIAEIVALFRQRCPNADIRLLTNGTLLRPESAAGLFRAGLSTLTVNNYTDGRQIIPPVQALLEHAQEFLKDDIRISMRQKHEVLTTRAGTAPNKCSSAHPPRGFCALPFTDIYVQYTGEVALCCFDAYGQARMGSVVNESLSDIWNSSRFGLYRRELLESGRASLHLCQKCDFDGFRDPAVGKSPLTRDALTQDRTRTEHGQVTR